MTLSSASSGSAPWVARWPPTFSRPDTRSWCTTCTDNRRAIICRRAPNGRIPPRALAEKSEVIFTSLPEPTDVKRVSLGPDGLIEGVKKGTAYFDLSTNSPSIVKTIHEAFAAKGVHMLDAPVSGGPSGAASRKMAIWVGGDKAAYDRHKAVLDAMGDRPAYIGPIGTATVAKLVHNMSGYAITCALAETFTMGVKAGMDPVALWEAVRQGVGGRRFTFDGLLDQFLPGKYDPPNFALKLATKDVK